MKRVRLSSWLETPRQLLAASPHLRQRLILGVTCIVLGLLVGSLAGAGAGAQAAIALAALFRESRHDASNPPHYSSEVQQPPRPQLPANDVRHPTGQRSRPQRPPRR